MTKRTAAVTELMIRDAEIVARTLELGDDRLLASDGPIGNQLPDLSQQEWGIIYRACKRIAARNIARSKKP